MRRYKGSFRNYRICKNRWIPWMIQVNFKKWNRNPVGDCLTFPVSLHDSKFSFHAEPRRTPASWHRNTSGSQENVFGNQFSTFDSPRHHPQGILSGEIQGERGSVPQATGDRRWTCLHMFRQIPHPQKKSDCIQKSRDTHSYGKTWKQDEKKFEIRRSVEFSSATARCIPWRVDGHSNGETCRNKRRIRWCGPFRIWNLEFSRRASLGETHPVNQPAKEYQKLKR